MVARRQLTIALKIFVLHIGKFYQTDAPIPAAWNQFRKWGNSFENCWKKIRNAKTCSVQLERRIFNPSAIYRTRRLIQLRTMDGFLEHRPEKHPGSQSQSQSHQPRDAVLGVGHKNEIALIEFLSKISWRRLLAIIVTGFVKLVQKVIVERPKNFAQLLSYFLLFLL